MSDNLMANESGDRIQNSDGKSLGYWAAHEQYSMRDLLKFVIEAEKDGFKTTMTSDHFHPWWHDDAYGNFVWVWIVEWQKGPKTCNSLLELRLQYSDIIQR